MNVTDCQNIFLSALGGSFSNGWRAKELHCKIRNEVVWKIMSVYLSKLKKANHRYEKTMKRFLNLVHQVI